MAALLERREVRGWLLALLILTLLPLLLSLADFTQFQRAFTRGGPSFAVFLALDVLLIGAIAVSLWRADIFTRWTRWRRSPLVIALLVLGGALWSAFAMLSDEIGGLAGRTPLIRLAVWLALIVWCAFLLRLSAFETSGKGRWPALILRFAIVQFMFLVALEIAIGLIFPQGATTGTAWYDPQPPVTWKQYTGWAAPVTGAYMVFSPGEFSTVVRFNAQGLRDDPTSYDKPPDTFRVLILGDSTTQAIELMLEDTYHARLERLFSTGDQRVEFVAGAVGGWGTDQELEYFRHEGCRYQPDLVLLQMSDNDIINNYRPFESGFWGEDRKPYYELDGDGALVLRNSPFAYNEAASVPGMFQAAHGQLRIISRTYLLLTSLLSGKPRPLDTTTTIDTRLAPDMFIPLHVPDLTQPDIEAAYAVTGALLRELRREVEACDATLAAFMIPVLHFPEERTHWPERVREAYPDWDGYDAGYRWDFLLPEARMTALAGDAGIPIMPYERLVAEYDAYVAEHGTLAGFTWRWMGHFTPYGAEQIAQTLYGWLANEGLVPVQTYTEDPAPQS